MGNIHDDPVSGGSRLSSFFGSLFIGALIISIFELVTFHWVTSLIYFGLSILLAYIGYRLAGGARNPGLVRVILKEKNPEIVGIPGFSWQTKVEALFAHAEEQARGDIRKAVELMVILSPPQEVADAYSAVKAEPTASNWLALKEAYLRNPPKGHR
jgi:hypothetical protein